MSSGIHLTLMIGPVMAVPVGQDVIEALTEVEVKTTAGKASGFTLTFVLSTRSPLHTLFLLSSGSSLPLIRVIIAVTVNGTTEVLMDGVMTRHEISPGGDAGHATLKIFGDDLTRVMDYIDWSGIPYPAMPPEARVALCIAKYAMFGMIPLVIPRILPDLPIPIERIPGHKGTDLTYVQDLAQQAGYVFYITPGPAIGVNTAYWGPEIKIGVPQPALNINMDAHTNVESLTFSYDPQSKAMPIVFILNEWTHVPIPIPIPDVSPLNPPLGLVPPIPVRFPFLNDTASMDPMQAAMTGLAEAARSSEAVTGSGTLNVVRYGHILQARKLVGVRGAGTAFDGAYYVKSVTHSIKRGEYKQSFELSRNGLISLFSVLPT